MNNTLFDQVEAAILAFPENVNVGTFLEERDGRYVSCIAAYTLILDLSDRVECSISWSAGPIFHAYKDASNDKRVQDTANALGVPFDQAERLCYPSRWPAPLWNALCATKACTPEHAAVAIRAITEFRQDPDAFCAASAAK
jgi:hypothetical protein